MKTIIAPTKYIVVEINRLHINLGSLSPTRICTSQNREAGKAKQIAIIPPTFECNQATVMVIMAGIPTVNPIDNCGHKSFPT